MSNMKVIKTVDAEGMVICHDITQIVKGVVKDSVFRKGHIVKKEDIPVLLSLGKDHLYVWEEDENMLHENDAAEILCELCLGKNMERSQVKEGKINLFSSCHGLFKINREALKALNAFGQMMIACKRGDEVFKKGDILAGTRVIPLVIEKEKMEKAKSLVHEITAGKPIFDIKEFKEKKIAIITTGNEVFHGRIKDAFTPVILEKVSEFGGKLFAHEIINDDDAKLTDTILTMIREGAEVVICTGGMSVDPDDKTPLGIKNTGANLVTYGAPVLPGSMFLLAYYNMGEGELPVPIMGLPGGVMFSKHTVFDLILPRVMADDMVSAEDIANLGEGGLLTNHDCCSHSHH